VARSPVGVDEPLIGTLTTASGVWSLFSPFSWRVVCGLPLPTPAFIPVFELGLVPGVGRTPFFMPPAGGGFIAVCDGLMPLPAATVRLFFATEAAVGCRSLFIPGTGLVFLSPLPAFFSSADLSVLDPLTGLDGFVPEDGEGFVPKDGEGCVPKDGEGFVPEDGEGFVPEDGEGFVPENGEGFL